AEALGWLGLLSEEPIAVDESPFNLVADAMQSKMELKQGDRDMTVMQHQFDVEWPDGSKNIIYSRMLDFGDPAGDTSIARTVALPAATAARLILQNTIGLRGVQRPLAAEIYEPVLSELAELGICLTESIETA
ncbi:MAG: saccharopine dehydrogenase C-terminal domain-containing protein, partial [Bacteroidales bacterium]|nr:saccharopine dehydrogenase C-terminal domain-containing protein [Bacteroidales bacterium]